MIQHTEERIRHKPLALLPKKEQVQYSDNVPL